MRRSVAVLWTMAATAGLLVVGCTRNNANGPVDDAPPAGVTDEQSAMKADAVADPFVISDEQSFADQAIAPTDYVYVSGMVDASITPLRWGRIVNSVTRTFTITTQTGDTLALGHVHKVIGGILKIKALQGTDTVTVQKPFTDQTDRNLVFKRVSRGPQFWKNWKLVASSLVKGETPQGGISIRRLELRSAGNTITITDPLGYFFRYRWLGIFRGGNNDMAVYSGGDTVHVRVALTSTSPDTDLVALRYGADNVYNNRLKMNLVAQNDSEKVYERSFVVRPRAGFFTAGVEAATRATLFDDSPGAYAVSFWGVPYRVY